MESGKTADTGHLLIEPGIIFHRARPKRIHAEVDRVVPGRDAGKMSDHVYLRHLGNTVEAVVAKKFCGQGASCYRHVQLRQMITDASCLRTLKDQTFILGRVLSYFFDRHKLD